MRKMIVFLNILAFILICFVPVVIPQGEQIDKEMEEKSIPKIFIECEESLMEYIKKEIVFIDYVNSKEEAQIVVTIEPYLQKAGGIEHTLYFEGQKNFDGDNDVLKYQADIDEKEDKINKELVNIFKMGIMRYVGKTDVSDRILINFMDKTEPTDVVDKWDFWVFSISANTFITGENLYKSSSYYGSFSANRVTPELKIRFSLGGSFRNENYTFDDEVIESSSNSQYLNGLIVKSIGDHWSIGSYFSANSSTYSNIKSRINPAPAIEFNIFPYDQSTKRQLRLLYRIGYISVKYREETIYEKTYENLWRESLSATLELKQKWGTLSASLEGSHYFHDFSKNRLELRGELSLRIVKGLDFNIRGNYSRIHDQLSLPREGASLEEILLHIKELETTYDYYFSVGLSYTFGSVKSNVVNPRFGTGGKSISITM
ncbi:MAG: hypothetical protein ACOC6P_03435 [Candidatus Aminicenantaceae bacterium]